MRGDSDCPVFDLASKAPVPRRFLRLTFERFNPPFQLGDDVPDPVEVILDAQHTVQRGSPAGLVFGNSCGFLENVTAVFGFVREDRIDHAQFEQAVRVGAHAGIHEQVVDIGKTADFLVYEIFRFAGAEKPSGNGHFRHGEGKTAGFVIYGKRDLGHSERFTAGRTFENHILHPLRPYLGRPLFAENPPYGVHHIGLAAAVRPHNRSHAAHQTEIELLGERLKSIDFNA